MRRGLRSGGGSRGRSGGGSGRCSSSGRSASVGESAGGVVGVFFFGGEVDGDVFGGGVTSAVGDDDGVVATGADSDGFADGAGAPFEGFNARGFVGGDGSEDDFFIGDGFFGDFYDGGDGVDLFDFDGFDVGEEAEVVAGLDAVATVFENGFGGFALPSFAAIERVLELFDGAGVFNVDDESGLGSPASRNAGDAGDCEGGVFSLEAGDVEVVSVATDLDFVSGIARLNGDRSIATGRRINERAARAVESERRFGSVNGVRCGGGGELWIHFAVEERDGDGVLAQEEPIDAVANAAEDEQQ